MEARTIMSRLLFVIALGLLCPMAATAQDTPPRVIAFGAHPDDAELQAGGVAALWAREGAHVKLVSMTNGDIGHFAMAGGPLAVRRRAEVQACADIFGVTTEVLDIHDGELMPTLENRRTVARLIRDWQADIVMSHRRYDYHADHRYTGELVEDAAVVVVAAFFEPYSPRVERNPIVLHYPDPFEKPYPFQPDFVVGIDDAVEAKWDCIRAMPSQFADADSWQARYQPNVPDDPIERREYILDLVKRRYAEQADRYRDRLIELYGEERGSAITYAEAFEICQYGRQPTIEELKELFPTF
jgi:LmbE family N-acetylglucosaminyl deacetylase